MPQMILNRNHRLATTRGHILMFKKGEPTHVAPEIVKDALSVGAEFIDKDDREEALPEEPVAKDIPQGDDRETVLYGAFKALIARDARGDFNAAGVPAPDQVSNIVGFKVEMKELKKLWGKFKEEQAEA